MVASWVLLPLLLVATPSDGSAACPVLVHVDGAPGHDLPDGLWARVTIGDGRAAARPLVDGSTRMDVPCGPVRIDIGSSPREADGLAAEPVSAYQLSAIVTASAVTGPEREVEVSLLLPQTGLVEFEALGPEGNGVLGFSANLIPTDNPATSWFLRSGSGGRARLRAPLGAYRLSCSHPDLQRLEVDGSIVTSENQELVPVTLTTKGLHITARFAGEVGLISGAVNTREGSGLASIEVEMKTPQGVLVSAALTDAEGVFRDPAVRPPLEVKPVDLSWTFEPASRTCPRVPCQVDFIAVARQEARLRLRIVDPCGAPITQASVLALPTCDPHRPSEGRGQPTDGDGRISVPCPGQCAWWLSVGKPGWLSIREERQGVDCSDELVLTLRPGAVVRGRVVDAEGKPVPALPITAPTTIPPPRGVTDSEGRFELRGLCNGPQLLRIDDRAQEERALQRCDGPCGPANLDALDGQAQEVNLRLVPGGRICASARTNGSLLRACLRVYGRGSAAPFTVSDGGWGQDPVCSDPLPPGGYEVRVDCPSHEGSGMATWVPGVERREDAQPVMVRAGERTPLGQVPLVPPGEVELVFSDAAHQSAAVRAMLDRLAQGWRGGAGAQEPRKVELAFREPVTGSPWRSALPSAPVLRLSPGAWPPITWGSSDLPSGTWQLRLTLGYVVLESEAPVQVRSGQQVEARLRPVP